MWAHSDRPGRMSMTHKVVAWMLAAGLLAAGSAGAGSGDSGTEARGTAKDKGEQRILDVLDDMFHNQREGYLNAPPEDGRLLRVLTESVGAKHAVELGTSNGYSGLWFCLALRNTGGRLTTHEIDAERVKLARENFRRAGVDGIATVVEGDAHETVRKLEGPIDLVFLDADKTGYKDYLEKLLPLVRPGGLILAHNTSDRGSDMKDYLEEVTSRPDLETIFLREHDRGIGVTLKKR